MDIFVFILSTLGLGILCSIPGVFIGNWMTAKGVIREPSLAWIIGGTIVSLFFWRIMLPQVSLQWLIVAAVLIPWWGMYKADLWTTWRRGKRWWLDNEQKETNGAAAKVFVTLLIITSVWVLIFAIIQMIAQMG